MLCSPTAQADELPGAHGTRCARGIHPTVSPECRGMEVALPAHSCPFPGTLPLFPVPTVRDAKATLARSCFSGAESCERWLGSTANSCSADVMSRTWELQGSTAPLAVPWLSQCCYCSIWGCWDRCKSASRSHPAAWQANFAERLQ